MKVLKYITSVLILFGTDASTVLSQQTQQKMGIEKVLTLNNQHVHTVETLEAGTALREALTAIEAKYNVAFLYEDYLLESKTLKKDLILHSNAPRVIQSVIRDFPLILKQLDGRVFGLVRDRKAETELRFDELIAGSVTDSEGEPLPGVNITVKGTTQGTSTSSDGSFTLQVETLQDTLVFSFVGFQTQEVPINGRTEIHVTMVAQTYSGEELVVVGYGTRTKETLTGSVSAVSGEDLEKVPVTNISNTIAGRLPGVITWTNSGEPGYDGSVIRIRGEHTLNDNSPLIVIDGVPDRSGGLDRINPRDIENISVLKDASAAIYGARAANGVILITTKRGREGQAPQFSFNFNQGFNQPTRIPEMADAPTYMRMLNEVDMYRNNAPRFSEEEIQQHADPNSDPWLYPNTDWFAASLKPLSQQTRADMSVAGGTENITYYLSLGGLTEDGYYERSATRYNQYNFRSNIDAAITDNISLRFDVNGRYEDRNFPTRGAGATFRMLMRGKPNEAAFWPSGHPGPDIENGENPVVTGTDVTGYDNDERYYLQTNISLNVEIPWVDGLGIRGSFAYDKDFRQRKLWETPWMLYSFDRDTYLSEGGDPVQYLSGAPRGPAEPALHQWSEDGDDLLVNLVAEYQQDFEDHSVGILAGAERQTFSNSFFDAYRRNYISPRVDLLFAGGQDLRTNYGIANEGARLNFFSRINYDYQDKYLFEVIGRYDGSYIFPKGNRFGFFPSFSAGWRLTEEEFFTNAVGFFDELKLRVSWGRTGNDRVGDDNDDGQDDGVWQYLTTYGFGAGYVLGIDSEVLSIYQLRTPNTDITWEVANQFDVGIEGLILDEKLSFEFDYFNYLRTDILAFRNASVPQTSGLSLPRENIGEVSSWGFDGSLTWRDQVNNDFFYDITLNAGWATNKIKYWDEAPGAPEWQQSTGAKMETGLYYNVLGVFRDQEHVDSYPSWPGARPGDLIFEDTDGDGVITANDRIRIERNDVPEWTGGVTFSGSYRQFDFTVFFQGAAGASQYIQTESGEFGNYFQEFAEERWTPDNPDAEGPRAFSRTEEYWIANPNTYFFRKTDYLRLKTLEIGYNLSPDITSRLGLQNLRLYANGFNLLTWDTFNLMDPEASNQSGAYYPQKRVFNIGLSVTF